MKKRITTILIIAGIIGLIYLSYTGNKKTQISQSFDEQSNSSIEISNNDQELGDISMKNGKRQITFILKNTGDEDIVLGKASTSCMCTSAYVLDEKEKKGSNITMRINPFLDQTVSPGETRKVIAVFDPNAHGPNGTGPISRSVMIETNSNITPSLSFNFFGNVIK